MKIKELVQSKMTIGDFSEINQNRWKLLRSVQMVQEWMMNLGNTVTFQDVMGSRGNKKQNDILENIR
jgi:hypothetical protein